MRFPVKGINPNRSKKEKKKGQKVVYNVHNKFRCRNSTKTFK